jgi:cell division protein FtsB
MREIRQRRATKRRLYSYWTILVLVIVLGLFARSAYGVYLKAKESGERASQAEQELFRLTERNRELDQQITRLKTEEGIEAEIRETYRMAKPGENLAIILGAEEAIPTSTSQGIVDKMKKGVKKVLGR